VNDDGGRGVKTEAPERQLLQEDQTKRGATMQPRIWSQSDRAARLAAIPAGEGPANRGDPMQVRRAGDTGSVQPTTKA
jgi:hypothetical protein